MSDAESLEIKKRARRRLVGAVALALLAAVILPLMMEQEPHPGSGDIQISIPPRPGLPVATRAEVPPPLPPAEDSSLADLPPVADAAPPTAASTPAAPTAAVQQGAGNNAAAGTGIKEQAAAREAERALAAIEGSAPAPRGDSFVLQIGAFADAGKADRLVAELKGRGFPAYTEQAGKITRVRIGPLKGRALTDKTAAELALLGYSTVSSPL